MKAKVIDSIWNGRSFEWGATERDPMELLSDVKWLTGAAFKGRQAAMDRGTLTNDFVDQWAKGMRIVADQVPEWCDQRFEEGKMMDGASHPTPWKADRDDLIDHVCCALKWLAEREPDIRVTQIQVRSERPMYAGTADALGGLEKKARLFEFKTGQPNRSHAMQVVAYAGPLEKEVGRLLPTVVYFNPERYREVTIYGKQRQECKQAFRRALKDFGFSKEKTPWQNGVSVRMDSSDLPFVR